MGKYYNWTVSDKSSFIALFLPSQVILFSVPHLLMQVRH